jgi:SAM-dependent methyltransferase
MAERWGGGRLLNIGCGHGADFLPFRGGFQMWGVDFSHRLLELGGSYRQEHSFKANLVQAEASRLPFTDSRFDWAIAVAVYHHVRGEMARVRAWEELYRVLRPGGEAFVTVWNRGQPRFWLQGREVLVPWRLPDIVVHRYHYLYTYRGLKKALMGVGFEVVAQFPERRHRLPFKGLSRNICALVRRP